MGFNSAVKPGFVPALLIWGIAALAAIILVCSLEHPLPYRLLVIAGGIYVIVRHRTNIQRLLAGTEPPLGQHSPEPKVESQI